MRALLTKAQLAMSLLSAALLLHATACDPKKEERGGGTPEGGAGVTNVSGSQSNDEFCKTVVAQSEAAGKVPPDPTKRTAYYTEQKALNAKLLKLAPPAVNADTQRFAATSNAIYDAFLAGDMAAVRASSDGVTSPEYLAAAKRISAYCGIKTP